jgi:hypothetical protein
MRPVADFDATPLVADRRRCRRFDAKTLAARASLIRTGRVGPELEPCTLLDLGYGGVSFRVPWAPDEHAEYRFLIDLAEPFSDLVLVRARVCWVRRAGAVSSEAGAVFVESSKGWLGPEDDPE